MVEPGEQGQGGGSTPDVADALLAELEAGGELVGGEGRFTIDAGQATGPSASVVAEGCSLVC